MITLHNQSMAHFYFKLVVINFNHLEDFELELNTTGSVSLSSRKLCCWPMTTREEVQVGEEPNRKDFRVKKQKVFKSMLCHYLHLKRTTSAGFFKYFKIWLNLPMDGKPLSLHQNIPKKKKHGL
jgi:hypothetical protein